MPGPPRIPPQVLEEARRLALETADGDDVPRSPSQERRIKEKVVAALRKLPPHKKTHPMD